MAMTNAATANTMINSAPGSNLGMRNSRARKSSARIPVPSFIRTGSLDSEIMAPFASHIVIGHGVFACRADEYFCAGFDRFLRIRGRIGLHACPERDQLIQHRHVL